MCGALHGCASNMPWRPIAFAATDGEVCARRWTLWSVLRMMVVARGSKAGGLPMIEGLITNGKSGRRAGELDMLFWSSWTAISKGSW
jgi:hypothetical protein